MQGSYLNYSYCILRKKNYVKWIQINKKLDMILKYSSVAKRNILRILSSIILTF